MLFLRRHFPRLLLILALTALGAVLCALLLPQEFRAVQQQLLGFPDSDIQAHQARPAVLAALCFLPALASLIYSFGGTLDRYIARQFLGIFGICLTSLFLIWLLINLTDRIGDFSNSRHVFRTIVTYYVTSTPYILLLLLPYSLLLSLLHSLGKLSTNREIIACVQSGRGMVRITRPVIVAGAFCALLSLGLNYHWAPIAEGLQDEILAEATDKPEAKPAKATQAAKASPLKKLTKVSKASNVLYRNPENRRLWMIGTFPPDYQKDQPLLNVEVSTTGLDHRLESRLTATSARWDRNRHLWTFENAVICHYAPGREPEFESHDGPLTIDSWPETPWQLIKPGLRASYLGIPDLNSWLNAHSRLQPFADPAAYLTQWHYRWALPFSCLVTVLLATPLAIHFSRRGPGGGIFLAVFLSALMLLVSNIVLAFGEAGTLNPALAAWLPNLAFTLLGIALCRRRITGRPIHHSLRNLLVGKKS